MAVIQRILCGLAVWSLASEAKDAPASPPARALMDQMLADMKALQPLLVSDARFMATENRAEINRRVESLSKISDRVMAHKSLQSAGYQVSGQSLNRHIQQVSRALKSGNISYARWALASTPYACASCHSQGIINPKPLWTVDEGELAGTPMERADFLFSTQNYDVADQTYTQIVRGFTKADASDVPARSRLERALKQRLLIWVRVRRDLPAAVAALDQDLKNPHLPSKIRVTMKRWQKQIRQLIKHSAQDQALRGEKLLALARKKLPPSSADFKDGLDGNLVDHLWVSGLLYGQLRESSQGAATPEFLYWLAMVDLGLNHEVFFSLGNAYLRDCIEKYPRGAFSARCYAEYERQTELLYSGSRGTDFPLEVKEDLRELRLRAMSE